MKIGEAPSMDPNSNDQQQFRLNKINEVKDYFIAEIRERELMGKTLSDYITSFDYFDKSLIVLSATSGSISIAAFATVIGAPVGLPSASFSFRKNKESKERIRQRIEQSKIKKEFKNLKKREIQDMFTKMN